MPQLHIRLSDLMTQRKISASDIEKMTGLNKNTIISILTGVSKNPSASTLQQIAKALDVTLEYILSGEDITFYNLTSEQLKVFNHVTSVVTDIVISKNLHITIDKLYLLIKETYEYSIKIEPSSIDERFIHWLIGKYRF